MGNQDRLKFGPVERLVRHDRAIVFGAVALIFAMAAAYTVFGIGMRMSALDMTRMAPPLGQPMDMGPPPVWTAGYAALVFLMWWIMMIAMMTPSVAPVLLLFGAVTRPSSGKNASSGRSLAFLSGYLTTWAGFSAVATGLQWSLEQAELSGAMMAVNSLAATGAILVAAGAYQLSSLKSACLSHCRSPVEFLIRHNRPGLAGAFRTGAHHGVFCVGCCWALMALLFVGGIMNLYWIVALALYVLAEKLLPHGMLLARTTAIGMAAAGLFLLASSLT
jgi:predicted metal-binding membrane protein